MNSVALRQRGASLIEALLACAVLGIALLGAMRLQASLRLAADLARQRAEAVRLAQTAMEDWRSFAVLDALPGIRSYADIASDTAPQGIAGGNASFSLTRSAEATSDLALKSTHIDVTWLDRSGRTQAVALHSMIAGLDPKLAAALAISPTASPVQRPLSRHAWLPLAAHDLGDGGSVLKPANGIAWVFDNASGALTGRCTVAATATSETLTASDVKDCRYNAPGFVLGGFVRFATGDTADAAHPTSAAMPLHIAIDTPGGLDAAGHALAPTVECFDDSASPATPGTVAYECAIYGAGLASWSGRALIVPLGWTLGSMDGTYRTCRYSSDANADHHIANAEHPLVYDKVSGPLSRQNFLIVRGPIACPAGTVAHDPDGLPTPL